MILSALNLFLRMNLSVFGRLADHKAQLRGKYNAKMISQIENYIQFIIPGK
jgi:hypothetical protein